MGDLIVLAMILAFFAVCIAYVALCDRIIGPDPAQVAIDPDTALEPEEEVAAR